MHEINSQSGDYPSSVFVLLPVKGKRIKLVAKEVHHGEDGIMDSFFQPFLCILINGMISVPSFGRIAVSVSVFPYGRAADLHPRLQFLDFRIDLSDDTGNVVPSPLGFLLLMSIFPVRVFVGKVFSLFRITDVSRWIPSMS